MKKLSVILVAILIVSLCVTGLVACNDDKDTHKGAIVIEIGDANALKDVNNKLGADYDQATFKLTNDIVIEGNWTPIGNSEEQSFRGIFDGNGKTITYSIEDEEITDYLENWDGKKYYGLFGYTHGATVKNLNVNVVIDMQNQADLIYAGGLIAYAYGDTNIENVNVCDSKIKSQMPDARERVKDSDGEIEPIAIDNVMNLYAGGLLGYAVGKVKLNNVNVDCNVSSKIWGSGSNICRLTSVYAGGVAGYVRSIDIVHKGYARNEITKANYTGGIKVEGVSSFVGGIGAVLYNTKLEKANVNSNAEEISVSASARAVTGGLVGLADNTEVLASKTSYDTIKMNYVRSNAGKAFSVGGAVGYLENNSSIDKVSAIVNEVKIDNETSCFTGGVVGICNNSKIDNATAKGELIFTSPSNNNYSIVDAMLDLQYGELKHTIFTMNGGIVGEVRGRSTLGKLVSEFKAYQPIIGSVVDGFEVIDVDEGANISEWLTAHGYDFTFLDGEKTCKKEHNDVEEGKDQYHVYFKLKVVDATDVKYLSGASRAVIDANSGNFNNESTKNEFGVEVGDSSDYTALSGVIDEANN